MKTVYFDTNVYRHLYKLEDGITKTDIAKLKALLRADKLRILLSTQVVEETISAVPSAANEAFARFKLMHKLAKRKRMIKFHIDFVQAVRAYARGEKIQSPYIAPPPRLIKWLTAPNLEELLKLAGETKAHIQEHHNAMTDIYKNKIAPQAAEEIRQRQRPSFTKYWNDNSITYIRELAGQAGVLKECEERGLDGLFEIRFIKIASTAHLSLAYANTYEGRTPKFSDSRDMQHALLSSATDTFITDDNNLRRIMKRVPIDDYKVLNFNEMLRMF
jgi:hypothetical protein